MAHTRFYGELHVLSIDGNRFLRNSKAQADQSQLSGNEFLSFCLRVETNEGAFRWDQISAQVDGQRAFYWKSGSLEPFREMSFSIPYEIMAKYMTTGTHTVTWYLDGRRIVQTQLTITKNSERNTSFRFPTKSEIKFYQNGNQYRSPYITAYFNIPKDTRYTEYMIDFKADHLPKGTYCSLGNWGMDYSGLNKQSKKVRLQNQWINAYAGFQRIATGETVSIMSFWDVFCTDAGNRKTTIEAKILYPQSVINGGRFWGEGTGARCAALFDWDPKHWYRMHLKCIARQGTTFVEQWVQDLETEERTLLSVYDTGIPNSAFQGQNAAFLENFLPEAAGEVRSMEMCNARYLDEKTNHWKRITQVYLAAADGMPAYQGSYDFGVDPNDHIWMVTSGVGGDWFNNGKGKKGTWYTLSSKS